MQCISRAPLASRAAAYEHLGNLASRAAAYEHLGNHAEASADYNAALRLDSRFAIADFRRAATLYDAQGNAAQAQRARDMLHKLGGI